jgi:hypothetical protein
MEQLVQSGKKLRDEWESKINAAEKKYADYHNLVTQIREYYRNEKKCNKQNIFWASVETLKPFMYFKQPKPYIVRCNKTCDKAEVLACKMLERALAWNMKQFDFDSVVKYARNDFLLSGMGILWERYLPTFRTIGDGVLVKDNEIAATAYINPTTFIADMEKVDVWEDVEWIAHKSFLSVEDVAVYFGDKIADYIAANGNDGKCITDYEIWDRKTRTIYHYSPEYPVDFLRVQKDTLHLSGFFPMPKPIMATLTNDGIIPVPDYVEIKSMLDELDGVNNRMRLTMQALKVSGCYDNAFPELANILDKDVTLISLNDFDKLKDAGGIRGIIDFAPIEQYVVALKALAERREVLKNSIYEVTGVSDIMRGMSVARETATAVTQKTNFGTLRNQDRQNDMQRFLKDLLQIKAEIICEQFSAENLISFLSKTERQDEKTVWQAVHLLKNDKLRDMIIGLETDTCFSQEAEEKRILETLNNINEMINQAFRIVSLQPALLPLYRQMIESAVAMMPNARQFEAVLEDAFNKIEITLNTTEKDKTAAPQNNALYELQKQKQANDYALKKEQNAQKWEELRLKQITELNKVMKDKEEK